MATKASIVQERPVDMAEAAAKIVKRGAKKPAKAPEPPPPTPLTELTDAEFLATDTAGEQLVAIRIRDGEIVYRGFGGATWALARAAVLDVNHMLEQETLRRLLTAEGKVVAIANAATG
jgi:hypothetical protein